MAIQTTMRDDLPGGIAGQIAENCRKKTRNFTNSTPEIDEVSITAADASTTVTVNSTAYNTDSKTVTITAADLATTATVNGTGYEANSAEDTKTKTEIATELVSLINAGETAVEASLDGETVVITQASGSYATFTVVDTTNCSVAQTTVTKATIISNLATVINANETTVTATANTTNLELTSDVGTAMTVVGTTNATVSERTGASSTIGYGLLVSIDNDFPGRAHLPTAAADITTAASVAGITVRSNVVENEDSEGYQVYDEMECLSQGVIYVEVEAAVDVSDSVYVRHTASGTEQRGAFRGDADTADASILPGARFLEAGTAGQIVPVEINLP